MEFTGERFIPNISGEEIEIEHIQRYHFAATAIKGLTVLDAACGEGYGRAILAENAAKVYGLDVSSEAVEHAKGKYASPNLEFLCASIEKIPLDDQSIDCVVSFETIEHVDEEIQHCFMNEVKRILKPNGYLLLSTPNRRVYSCLLYTSDSYITNNKRDLGTQEALDPVSYTHLHRSFKISGSRSGRCFHQAIVPSIVIAIDMDIVKS